MYQLLLADILKFIKNVLWKNFTFCAYCGRCYGKKCSVSSVKWTVLGHPRPEENLVDRSRPLRARF